LPACEDGYQASVKDIKFYYDDILDTPDDEGNDIHIKVEIDKDHPFPINSTTAKTLYVICEIPSSIKEISVTMSWDPTGLEIQSASFITTNDEDHVLDQTKGEIKAAGINPGDPLTLQVKSTAGGTTKSITVTVEPGNITKSCEDFKIM